MNRYKKLVSDTVLMTIGNFSSKVLVFLMLPIYTYVLSTEEYGVADLFLTTVNLLVPILTFSITDATFRYTFDTNVDQRKNISNSLFCICSSVVLLGPILFILSLWNDSFGKYALFFVFLYLFNALNTCLNNYVRGTDRIKLFVGSSFVYTLLLVFFNILFLTVIRIGLYGYLTAMILAYAGSSIFMLILLKSWKIVRIRYIDIKLFREMIEFSIPMIFSTTAWWAMNSIDKYMLIGWYGIETSGLYVVAQKLPTIISVLSNIFVQAWQISALNAHGEKDSDKFYTNVYRVYEVGLVSTASLIILFTKPLATIMFQKDYYSAYIFAPILLLSGVYSCLSTFLQSPFVAAKKSRTLLTTTLVGLLFNILGNAVFLNIMGPMGATYATMIGFCITWLMRLFMSRAFVKIGVDWFRTIVTMILLFIEAILISYDVQYNILFSSIICVLILLVYYSLFKDFLRSLVKMVKLKIKK